MQESAQQGLAHLAEEISRAEGELAAVRQQLQSVAAQEVELSHEVEAKTRRQQVLV